MSTTTTTSRSGFVFRPTVPQMLKSRGLDRTSRDSLSSEYLSDQSPDDLSLLHRFNSLLSSANLPKLSNLLDTTPSLLIALYESIPPFQRVPFVDASAPSFGARLRNMKLLVGSIASGRYGLLTKETRVKLEELDLRRFCEKNADTVRDVIEIIVQVGERGRAALAESETPKKIKRSELVKTPRLKARTGRIAGNNLECTPTPKKRLPVLVLPVTTTTDSGESLADEKDSGWDGSILGVLSQTGQDDNGRERHAGSPQKTISDIPGAKPRRASRKGRSSPTQSTSSAPPSFLGHTPARTNDIADRCPAPPPYSEEDQGERDTEDTSDTPGQRRVIRRNDFPLKATPVKRLFAERILKRSTRTEKFGHQLLSSRDEGGPSHDSVLGYTAERGGTRVLVAKAGGAKDEEEKSQCTWVTEDQSRTGSRRSFSPLAGKARNTAPLKPFTPTRAIRWDADGAAYVPLPPSRPTSPVPGTPYSKKRTHMPSKSPLPFPPSLLRTMYWASSLPTPPLSPSTQKTQKISSQPESVLLSTPSRVPKTRKVAAATPLSPVVSKKRALGRRNSTSGSPVVPRKISGKSDLVVEVPEIDDRTEWESIQSSQKNSKYNKDDQNQMPLSFATTLVSPEPDQLVTDKFFLGSYINNRVPSTEPDEDSDRTTLYSVSTVSWGEDDPFTAALRFKRQIASEKLREAERSTERKQISGPDIGIADRLRWRAVEEYEEAEDETDSDSGLTDVEEELRALEEIGRKESIRQGLLLQKLMKRGG